LNELIKAEYDKRYTNSAYFWNYPTGVLDDSRLQFLGGQKGRKTLPASFGKL